MWVLLALTVFVANTAIRFAKLYRFNAVDDAYISFQYAKNWVLGHGLVFNPGEAVEGYTNFLWVVVLAPLYAATHALGTDFTRAAITLNVIIALLDLALLYAVARQLFRRDWIATAVALLFCALDGSYLGYAMSALEGHLVIFLSLLAVYVWQVKPRRAGWWLGLLFALITMARPDGALLPLAFFIAVGPGALLPTRRRSKTARKRLRRTLAAALLGAAGIYGAYFAWRYLYYGALLPNTFYLKVGDSFAAIDRGIEYTRTFFDDRLYLPALAALGTLGLRQPVVRWLTLYLLLHTAYIIYVGGDFYSGHRFYVVLLPTYSLLIGTAVYLVRAWGRGSRAWRWIRRRTVAACAMVAIWGGALGGALYLLGQRGYERSVYTFEILRWGETVDNNVRYMKWLGTIAPPGASMVVGDIGAAGFFGDLRVVDAYGVIDPEVARKKVPSFGRGKPGHEKRAARQAMLARNPTYIKWGYIRGELERSGYFVFTDFPPELDVPGLWVKENRDRRGLIGHGAIHFNRSELKAWSRTGDAFRTSPAYGNPTGQRGVTGQSGGYLSSFAPRLGDRATGRMLSPPFQLEGELMLLRVGGGRDPERLRVSLLVGSHRVHSATGHNHDVLGRREWDIARFRGQLGRLEVVDQAQGSWGHIMVDEVVQWSPPVAAE